MKICINEIAQLAPDLNSQSSRYTSLMASPTTEQFHFTEHGYFSLPLTGYASNNIWNLSLPL
jgi:hypothetical protein